MPGFKPLDRPAAWLRVGRPALAIELNSRPLLPPLQPLPPAGRYTAQLSTHLVVEDRHLSQAGEGEGEPHECLTATQLLQEQEQKLPNDTYPKPHGCGLAHEDEDLGPLQQQPQAVPEVRGVLLL